MLFIPLSQQFGPPESGWAAFTDIMTEVKRLKRTLKEGEKKSAREKKN